MPSVIDRVRNVFTNELRRDGDVQLTHSRRAASSLQSAVLGIALDVKGEWAREALSSHPQPALDDIQTGKIETLNKVLGALREIDPAMKAKLDPKQFQELVRAEVGEKLRSKYLVEAHEQEVGQGHLRDAALGW